MFEMVINVDGKGWEPFSKSERKRMLKGSYGIGLDAAIARAFVEYGCDAKVEIRLRRIEAS